MNILREVNKMSYFDNPERRAAWEKELAALKQEKEARRSGVFAANEEKAPEVSRTVTAAEPYRVRINYAQLLVEENMAKAAVTQHTPQRELQREVQREM